MFGHGTIRRMVMKNDFRRPATDEEIKQLQELARQAMQEGAFGMSAGLEYTPGRWSTTDEVTAIVAAIAPYGGIYISHERSEGSDPMWYWPTQHGPGPPTLLDAVMETIEIGERTGATVIASHVKAKGAHYWGTSHAVIQLIKTARARGVSVWADQYPYNTSGTDGNTVLIPTWVYGAPNEFSQDRDERPNFAELLRQRLTDAADAEKIRIDIAHEIRRRGGPENVVIFDCPDSSWIGKSVAELAKKYGISPVEMALKLQLEGFANRRGGARLRGFSMSEEDVEAYAVQPWTMTSSDAGIALPEDRPVHARFYGTFPRKLRHYAIDRGIMPVESAVRSMTSLPAQVLGLRDRGMIREGFWADVAILNLDRLRDKATFTNPHQYAEGVEYVLVNGQFVVESGKLTWALPGIVMAKSFVLGNEAKKNDQ
jgi:N-acyl-D-amino-acid deacylase